MRRGRLETAVVALVVTTAPVAGAAPVDATFGLAVSIAQRGGKPVRDEAWVRAQIDEANALFGPLGVRFRRTFAGTLPESRAELHSPGDRDALRSELRSDGAIPVFVVDVLEDVDEKGRLRMGVCWRKRYLILAAHAKPTVLAHELGHFFGNGHSKVPDNLMSYDRRGGTVFLDARQSVTITATAERLLGAELLKDFGPAPPTP